MSRSDPIGNTDRNLRSVRTESTERQTNQCSRNDKLFAERIREYSCGTLGSRQRSPLY